MSRRGHGQQLFQGVDVTDAVHLVPPLHWHCGRLIDGAIGPRRAMRRLLKDFLDLGLDGGTGLVEGFFPIELPGHQSHFILFR